MSHAGIKRVTLNYLTPSSADFLVVGVIIAKRPPKSFKSKKDGSDRGVMGFTLRDSPADYINVTVWGSKIFVDNFNACYRVGDVVDLINTKVIMRKPEDRTDIFQPPVTSCMELVFNELQSEISPHDLEDCLDYIKILHLPTKPPGNFLNLADIKANGKLFNGQYVNILVAVQRIGNRRDMKSRTGKDISILEIVVMDKTSSDFMVQTWEEDIIQRGSGWKPKDTVLFLSDVRVEWSEFRKAMVATITSRSVVTENPSTREAAILASFALTVPIQTPQLVDNIANTIIEPETIVNVMSCASVIRQAWSGESSDSFTALVFAVIQAFDLDGFKSVVVSRCSICSCPSEGSICPRSDCSEGQPTAAYDLRINLFDHTGRLSNCRLTGNTAEQVITVKPEVFLNLNLDGKTQLKWRWLLKKVSARLLIKPVGPGTLAPLISVVELKRISIVEYASKLPVA
ncbi:meiosis-specific with OB domain-containing protein [Halyomorpha halys]|uniref:meiosis-specific with OB domain-containing protein n=1 Tax=Halyomorpha halys TaxID=286706 RepID=UPI0006D50FB3|nr:meiosis-specific with OB domain-containing protein [Halyomorpha halys]